MNNINDIIIEGKEEINLQAAILMDTEHVCVPLSRYEQLITMETMLAIIKNANRTMESYRVSDFLKLLFPEDKQNGDDNA